MIPVSRGVCGYTLPDCAHSTLLADRRGSPGGTVEAGDRLSSAGSGNNILGVVTLGERRRDCDADKWWRGVVGRANGGGRCLGGGVRDRLRPLTPPVL